MSETATAEAIEAYGELLGVDVDGDVVLDGVFARLEREGVVERTGESGKAGRPEGGD